MRRASRKALSPLRSIRLTNTHRCSMQIFYIIVQNSLSGIAASKCMDARKVFTAVSVAPIFCTKTVEYKLVSYRNSRSSIRPGWSASSVASFLTPRTTGPLGTGLTRRTLWNNYGLEIQVQTHQNILQIYRTILDQRTCFKNWIILSVTRAKIHPYG